MKAIAFGIVVGVLVLQCVLLARIHNVLVYDFRPVASITNHNQYDVSVEAGASVHLPE